MRCRLFNIMRVVSIRHDGLHLPGATLAGVNLMVALESANTSFR
jgi:hypothetical protein